MNGLNNEIKRQRLSEWIKQDSNIPCLPEILFKYRLGYVESKGIEKDISC